MGEMKVRVKPRQAGSGETLVSQVANKLRNAIAAQEFIPGDKLPTEAQMVATYGVSRTVVREAVAALRSDGLVEPRQGAGVFVLQAQSGRPLPFQDIDYNRISSVIEVLELRTAVEVEAAGLAALRRSPQQDECIILAHRHIESLMAEGASIAEADFQFHMAIAQATNNQRFVDFIALLGQAMIPRVTLLNLPDQATTVYLEQLHQEHAMVVEAISAGDEDAARAVMRVHLRGSQVRYRTAVRG